jgi:hypothetical protein
MISPTWTPASSNLGIEPGLNKPLPPAADVIPTAGAAEMV